MVDLLTNKRLAVIKQLYKIGIEQSHLPEPTNVFSLLSFHDSIELFMNLCFDKKGKKVDNNKKFMDYFSLVPELEMKSEMNTLNRHRNGLKHHGFFPSKMDVEKFRVHTTDFFEINTKKIFELDFSEISLLTFIDYISVIELLKKAEDAIITTDFEESIRNSAIAFNELLFRFEEEKTIRFQNTPFTIHKKTGNFDLKLYSRSSGLMGNKNNDIQEYKKIVFQSIDNIDKSLIKVSDTIKVIGFGIDYKKFAKFKLLSPEIYRTVNGEWNTSVSASGVKFNQENSQFCIDFVIESALKMQEIDFDISNLIED